MPVAEGELPDFADLASYAPEPTPLPTPDQSYQALDASTCQCRAATNLSTANMVELERYWAQVVIGCDSKNVRDNLCLDRDLLALRAAGLRNEAAGSALQTFYQLAGLEVQKHYLQMGLDESRLTLSRIDRLKEKNIALPDRVDPAAVEGQIAQLEDQVLQLDFSRMQLNGQLQKLMGCPLDECSFYLPQLDWQPDLAPVDVALELATGLEARSDLRGLGLVVCTLEKNTLPVARGVLKFAESTVGTVEPQDGVLHWLQCHNCNEIEVPVRCRQLALFYEETERAATAEIKNAAYKIVLQQQRVIAAQRLVSQYQQTQRDLEETRDVNDVSIFEISNARGRVFDAQSKLIEKVVQLHLARVNLRQAQGMLAVECGYDPQLCREGCCDGACVRCEKQACGKSKRARRK